MPRKPKAVPRVAVDQAMLKRVADAMVEIDGQKSELGKDRSEYAAEAKEGGVHPKALGWCLHALKLRPAERRLLMDCFDSYRATLKLDDWQSAEDPQSDIEDTAAKLRVA